MREDYKKMLNMAEAIAMINNVSIERLDLQKVHMSNGEFDYYILSAWYSDGKKIRIREDCSIVEM